MSELLKCIIIYGKKKLFIFPPSQTFLSLLIIFFAFLISIFVYLFIYVFTLWGCVVDLDIV